MWDDYMGGSAGAARRRRGVIAGGALAVLAGVVLLLAACGDLSPPPGTAAEAYSAAHPSGQVPASLRAADLTREEVARRVAAVVGDEVRILLPRRLPPGFRPAEPYIAVGDGSARPNPEGWGSSYRVSYTDGRGLIVVTCGATSEPEGVVWSGDRLRVVGRPARSGHVDGLTVVATVEGRPRILVTGGQVAESRVRACATSMTPWR